MYVSINLIKPKLLYKINKILFVNLRVYNYLNAILKLDTNILNRNKNKINTEPNNNTCLNNRYKKY